MSSDEARHVLAHDAGIDLRGHGLSATEIERVRALRTQMRSAHATGARGVSGDTGKGTGPQRTRATRVGTQPARTSRASLFDVRDFHPTVVSRSKRAFVNRLNQDAVLRAFRSVNNRVKKLTGTSKDGLPLMGWAFAPDKPQLQATPLSDQSQIDEQRGMMMLMQGAMSAMRNPRAHEDEWGPDADEAAVLEALSLASLLHRFLDRCEAQASS